MAQRNAALDWLRGIAVLLVLGRHLTPPSDAEPGWVHVLMVPWIRGGWAGVDLFFVLSGYLVAGLLFRELRERGEVSIGRFLVRRGFKIYPGFYAMLVATLWLSALSGNETAKKPILAEVLLLQSYITGVWNHTWSLAVEEHFYLLLAVVFALLTRAFPRRRPSVRAISLAYMLVAAGCLSLRLHVADVAPFQLITHAFPTHLRIDTLCFGVLLSYVDIFHESAVKRFVIRFRVPLSILSALLFSLPFLLPMNIPYVHTWGFTVIAWGAGGSLLVARHALPNDTRSMQWLRRIAVDSYSIYLWHMPVLSLIVMPLIAAYAPAAPYLAYVSLYLAASLVVGIGAARVVEMPALRLRERFAPAAHAGIDRQFDGTRAW